MRRYAFYLIVTFLAFIIGCFVAAVAYLSTNINSDTVEVNPGARYLKELNKSINQIEAENHGFEELINAKDGELVTVQGYIDIKFLCHDVTDGQEDVCTTVLIGSSNEKKSLLIRLPVCSDLNKSSCIVWKPGNLCSDGLLCSDKIKIYDKNSKPVELFHRFQDYDSERDKHFWTYSLRNIQLKVTGKVTKIESKAYLKNPIDFIEFIEMK